MALFEACVSIIPTSTSSQTFLLSFKPHKLIHWLNIITLKSVGSSDSGRVELTTSFFCNCFQPYRKQPWPLQTDPGNIPSIPSPTSSRSPIAESHQYCVLNCSPVARLSWSSLLSLPSELNKWLQLYFCFLCLLFLSLTVSDWTNLSVCQLNVTSCIIPPL